MFIGSAKVLCPNLVIIPYEFEKYDEVSKLLYNILIAHGDFVQAVSCDEAYVDVTFCIQAQIAAIVGGGSAFSGREVEQLRDSLSLEIGERLREEIHRATGCAASVGVSCNMLLARLATQRAKPDGIFLVSDRPSVGRSSSAGELLRTFSIRDLPGIGHSLEHRCRELNLVNCGDVQRASLSLLQKEFGAKTGLMLHNYAQGRDDRVLENKSRQSVGCEINWGIRFDAEEQVQRFLRELCAEVLERLARTGMTSAGHVTVAAKKKLYQGEPGKFLGCGHCEDFSRSLLPSRAVSSCESLYAAVAALYGEIGVAPTDLRGVGIHLKSLKGGADAETKRDCKTAASGLTQTVPAIVVSDRRFSCRNDADNDEEEEEEHEDVEQAAMGSRHVPGRGAAGAAMPLKKAQTTLAFTKMPAKPVVQRSVASFFLPAATAHQPKKQKLG